MAKPVVPTEVAVDPVAASRQRLEAVKRRAYPLALAGGVVAIFAVYIAMRDEDQFIRFVYPWAGLGLAGFAVAAASRRFSLTKVEHAGWAVGASFCLLVQASRLIQAERVVEVVPDLASIVNWLLMCAFIAAFVVYPRRRALVLTTLLFAVSVAMTVGAALWETPMPGRDVAWFEIIRMYGILAMSAGLVSTVAAVRSELELARADARVLGRLATRDYLTKLPNRRGFEERAAVLIDAADRLDQPVGVALVDADHFKRINDEHGHAAGDEALRQLGAILRHEARRLDVISRWGGEEFAALLPATPAEESVALAERWRLAVASARLRGGPLTVSVGVTERRPGEPLDDALKRADAALYEAKLQGRDRVVCHP